jgi:hypothetical protein
MVMMPSISCTCGGVRAGVDQVADGLRQGDLLPVVADVLHQRRLALGRPALLEHAGDRERHLPQRAGTGQQAAHRLLGRLAFGAQVVQRRDQQRPGGEVAFRPGALEGELRRGLLPAVADLAHHQPVGDEDVIEGDLVEPFLPRQVEDGADGQAGGAEIDQELAQPLLLQLRVRHRRGAQQRDHEVAPMRVGGPDLAAVDPPPARHLLRPRAQAGEVGAAVGLGEADGEGQLAADNPGDELALLLLGAQPQDQRAGLAVADPVGGDGGADGQHLLQHHVALHGGALAAPVRLGPGHADPAAPADLLREFPVEGHPGIGPGPGRPVLPGVGQEGAQLGPQRRRLRRRVTKVEA